MFNIPSAQLAHSGLYTVVVTNVANSSGMVSSNALVNVTAGSVNVPPWLDAIPDHLVLVGDTLTLTARATDDNVPAQSLAFNLLPGAPSGAAIDVASGVLTWPAIGVPVPSTNTIGVRVADSGSPSLSATQAVRVVITANHAPVLANIPDFTADVLLAVRYTNVFADADPLDRLAFSLGPGAPAGARIHPTNGIFRWVPSRQQASSTNFITVIATDDGLPPRSDSRTFRVVVNDYAELYSSEREELVGDIVDFPIIVRSSTPVSNLTFNVEFDSHFTNFTVEPADGTSATLTFVESNRVGLRLTHPSTQPANGETLAFLSFTVASNQPSAFVAMKFTQPIVDRPGGASLDRVLTTPGRVVAIGHTALMEGTANAPYILIYGRPGDTQIVESATSVTDGGNWSLITTRVQSALVDVLFLADRLGTNRPPTVFFRARPPAGSQ